MFVSHRVQYRKACDIRLLRIFAVRFATLPCLVLRMPPTVACRMTRCVRVAAEVHRIFLNVVPTTSKSGLEDVSNAHIDKFLRRDEKRNDEEG
jgi:hypothetical protein